MSGTGQWSDGSSAAPWPQPNKAVPTDQPSGTFSTPNQFPPNASMMSGYQGQNQVPPRVSQGADGTLPFQPVSSGGAYNWNNDAAAAGQWQTQSQWAWPQNTGQWSSSQPFQYMVCLFYKHFRLVHMTEC